MLLSLLPGLRDLRTPLAVGYLWLTAVWLVFGDDIPEESEATGLAASVHRFVGAVGVAGSLGALTFVAYVLGAVLCLQYLVSGVAAPRDRRSRDPRAVLRGGWVRRAGMGFVSEATFRFLRENIRKRVDHALESGRHTVRGLARIAHLDPDIVRDRDDLIGGIYLELTTELQELVTKLGLHEKDRLWETYDRKNAEAEFRQSVALPMAVLTVIAAWIETPWILLGLVVPAVFLVQGLRRGQEARSEVYLAVVQNVIHSSVLDRVGEVPDEGGAEAPRGPAAIESGTPTRPDSPDRGTDKEPADVGGAAAGQRGGGPAVPVARGHRESAESPEVESHRGSPRP